MNKDAKIYIAGHLGMVGSAILRNLRQKGYQNFVLRSHEELNLISQDETESFFMQEKPEIVIDAAAKVGGIIANNTYRAQFIYENLMIQNNIIHSSYLAGAKKLLFLGSSCIYPRLAPQPLHEKYLLTGELEPTNEPYAIAKIAGIKMCESYYRQYGCDFISVMPTNLYGPNDNFNLENSHVLPAFIRKFHLGKCLSSGDMQGIRKDLNKRPIGGVDGSNTDEDILQVLEKHGIMSTGEKTIVKLWGSGRPSREFMHVDDMAAACIHIIENISAQQLYDDMGLTHINIGVSMDQTIGELAGIISRITNFNGEIVWDTSKPDGMPKKQLNVETLEKTGFKVKILLETGISNVYNEYKAE